MTLIKYFPDCKDSLKFIDSVFEKKHLCYTGKVEYRKRTGEWVWFDTTGKEKLTIFYDHDKELKRIENEYNFTREIVKLNDSLEYFKKTNKKNKIIEEGHYLHSIRTGEWTFYDTITEEKTIANYIPIMQWDSIPEDPNNPGTMIVAPLYGNGLLDGKWKKYNKEGVLLETKTYKKGIETKN